LHSNIIWPLRERKSIIPALVYMARFMSEEEEDPTTPRGTRVQGIRVF